MFYKILYDSLRLSFLNIFNKPAPNVPKVESELNSAVLNTLSIETRLLEKSEIETPIKRSWVQRLTNLSTDWTFKESAKCRVGIPELPAWRKRSGQKRLYSKVRKPGKDQRKRSIKLDRNLVLILIILSRLQLNPA